MCGITGIYPFNEVGSFYMINLAKAIDSLAKRGPDARGYYLDDFVGLGHRRLSIIDTATSANQPMFDEQKRYVLVFNGEIFNYKILRNELTNKGISFKTESDSEVLLHYFILEKEKCLDRFIGDFSFAIYDKNEKSLFIARDRMGIKPLLFYKDDDKFIFASEMKAILAYNVSKEIDNLSLYQYFQLGYVPKENSIFKNIFRLLPGEFLFIKDKKIIKNKYYSVPYDENTINRNISYEDAQKHFIDLLEDSVRLRLISDVPLGAFLSGGTDSSAIVALASRHTNYLNTFSIGFKDEPFFDETKYANLVAKKFNTNHTVFSLTKEDLHEHIYDVLNYLDEPFADSSSLPFYILSKRTAQKAKVALSGDGADEIFAGYNKYWGELNIRQGGFSSEAIKMLFPILNLLPKSRNGYFSNKTRQLHRYAEGGKMTPSNRYWRWSSIITEKDLSEYLCEPFLKTISEEEYLNRKKNIVNKITNPGSLNDVLLSDVNMVLPNDMLFKGDMMSMANGLEVREPFLDHRLVNFAFSLPIGFKIDQKLKKKLVRDTFEHILPQELHQRPKKGFDVPLTRLYEKELRNLIIDLFDEDFISDQKIFNTKAINELKNQVLAKKNYDQGAIWNIIAFQYWYKKYMTK